MAERLKPHKSEHWDYGVSNGHCISNTLKLCVSSQMTYINSNRQLASIGFNLLVGLVNLERIEQRPIDGEQCVVNSNSTTPCTDTVHFEIKQGY